MKKWLVILLALCILGTAAAETAFYYTLDSVTDCANTNSRYDAFYEAGELSVNIPGCTQDFVPQGIAYLEEEGWILISGYSTGKRNSALVAIDEETNTIVKEVFLNNMDGSAYTGHAGGVCVTEKNIYISNSKKLYRISLETFRSLDASGYCAFEEVIPVPVNSSYCFYGDGILWVGEFEYGTEYKTDFSHRAKSADGRFKAWTCGYVLDPATENEFKPGCITEEGAVPDYVLSMTERIQGIAFKDGQFYLSQSYGRTASSTVYRYENVLAAEPEDTVEVYGQSVPLWFLDSEVQTGALVGPPMSECMCVANDSIYLLFESGSTKYSNAVNRMDRVFRITGY